MENELTKRFREKIEKENLNLSKLAQELDLKYDRMYKWLKGKGNPKSPDDKVVEAWLNGKSSKIETSAGGNFDNRNVTDTYTEMNTADQIKVEVELISKLTGKPPEQIPVELGFSKDFFENVISKGGVTRPFIDRFRAAYQKYLEPKRHEEIEAYKKELFEKAGLDQEKKPHDEPMSAIYNLTESNKILADSHKILAETNQKLTNKIIESTASAPAKTPEAFQAMWVGLREFVLDVAVGTKYKSKDEAATALAGKLGFADIPKDAGKGIQKN